VPSEIPQVRLLGRPHKIPTFQETAQAAPAGAHVVKAFNTLFGHVLAADQAQGRPLDVFIAGDDAEAKARVSAFIESLALRPLDVGDLKMAHWLEGAGLLMIAPLSAKPSRTPTSGSASTHSAELACRFCSSRPSAPAPAANSRPRPNLPRQPHNGRYGQATLPDPAGPGSPG
jgi:hypothetical protein